MKVPSLNDRIVNVRAGLTDEDFGYDHWRAAQFSSPWRDRDALLIVLEPGEDAAAVRDRIAVALAARRVDTAGDAEK